MNRLIVLVSCASLLFVFNGVAQLSEMGRNGSQKVSCKNGSCKKRCVIVQACANGKCKKK
jgi:hypothetical protein